MSRNVIAWLVLSLIWGSTWLFIKLGLDDLPPITFAGIRFLLAASILSVVVALKRAPLPRAGRDWLLISVTGLLAFSLNYGLLFWGEQRTSSGLAAVLQTIIPVFGLVIAHLYLPDERITLAKAVGVLLGIIGVVLIFYNQMSAEGLMAFRGSVAIVIGAFFVAYSNVLVKARGGHLEPSVLAAGQMAFGLVPLLAVGIALEGNPLKFHWTPQALVSLFYLSVIGSAVAFLLFYWMVRRMDVTKTMLIPLVTPVIALLLGRLVLNESLSWRAALGCAGIMAGIGLTVAQRIKVKRELKEIPALETES